ncbi:DNA-directed RNA polymerase subunit alpha C-terminal domain-containing protein [Neisseriaceae bacterium CLB008]
MKIIQIVGVGAALFALTDEGIVWELNVQTQNWQKHKEIKSKCETKKMINRYLVSDLDVSNRVVGALGRIGIKTLGELKHLEDSYLYDIKGLGAKSIFELKAAMAKFEAECGN